TADPSKEASIPPVTKNPVFSRKALRLIFIIEFFKLHSGRHFQITWSVAVPPDDSSPSVFFILPRFVLSREASKERSLLCTIRLAPIWAHLISCSNPTSSH